MTREYLAELQRSDCIPVLCKALSDEQLPRILEYACITITNLAAWPEGRQQLHNKIVRPLVALLAHYDPRVRVAALLSVSNLALDGVQHAVMLLVFMH